MLGKIQGSLSRYGQGDAQSLGYGEQFRKLSPTMQAAIPALLAASGLGLGAYGLYKLFGSGSGKEEEEKTAAYPALTKSAVIGHAIGGGLGGAYGVAKSDKDNKFENFAHGLRRGANIGSGSVVGGLLGVIATMALKNKYPSMSSKLHFPSMLAGGVGGGFAGNWLTDKLYGPAPWRVKKIKKKKG